MTQFAVYQIQLTAAQRKTVNESGDFDSVPAFAAKTKMSMDFSGNKIGGLAYDAFDAGYYTHVANIIAEDYNDCFEVGNIGPDRTDGAVSSVERLGKMSSLSVGDIIVHEDGTMVVIAPIGFVAFSHNTKAAA